MMVLHTPDLVVDWFLREEPRLLLHARCHNLLPALFPVHEWWSPVTATLRPDVWTPRPRKGREPPTNPPAAVLTRTVGWVRGSRRWCACLPTVWRRPCTAGCKCQP